MELTNDATRMRKGEYIYRQAIVGRWNINGERNESAYRRIYGIVVVYVHQSGLIGYF